MTHTEELLSVIDALEGQVNESVINGIKFLVLSQEVDRIRKEHPQFHDIEKLELRITLKLGAMVMAGVGVLVALDKFL